MTRTGKLIAPWALFLLLAGTSPVTPASADLDAGEELYDLSCANCHGKNMVNPGTSSFDLRTFPLDQKQRFMNSVKNGKGFMPALGGIFDEDELEQIWQYVTNNHTAPE